MIAGLSDNARGSLLMVASMAAFTINDVCIKLAGLEIPFFQLLFLRGVMATSFLIGLGVWLGGLRWTLPRRDWGLIALRSTAEGLAAFCFLTALFNMPIANVTAVLQVTPLTVTLASLFVFREKIGWRRMLAILVGLAGVLLIVRPGPDGFNAYAAYALIAVVMITIRDLAARRLSVAVPSLTAALVAAVTIMVAAGMVSLTETWAPISLRAGGLILVSAVFILGGYLFSVLVMRVGDVGFVAPFRYTGLVWALVLGLLIFGEWPDAVTMLGAAIVVGTGIFTLYREARLARRAV